MRRTGSSAVDVIRVAEWEELQWLAHGFSTRMGGVSVAYSGAGDLNLGFTAADERAHVEQNRERFIEAVTGSRGPEMRLVTVKQVHSAVIQTVVDGVDAAGAAGTSISCGTGDGMITAEPGILLGVLTADCIPVLVADMRQRVVGAFHAGWRGTVRRIAEQGVGKMRAEFGSRVEDLTGAIGPGIGRCCYAVGDEVREEFESQFEYAKELFHEEYEPDPVREKYPKMFLSMRAPGHRAQGMQLHLDLIEANRRQLIDAGIGEGKVHAMRLCTACDTQRYFSHRAEHGHTGRMMAVIGSYPDG